MNGTFIKEYIDEYELEDDVDNQQVGKVYYVRSTNKFRQYKGHKARLHLDRIPTPAEDKLERIRAILEE